MIEEIELALIKASRRRRIAAFLIDHLAFTFIMAIISILVMMPHFLNNQEHDQSILGYFIILILGILLFFMKDSYKGISIGRWIMGIRVGNESDYNTTPEVWVMFVRNIFLIIYPIEFIVLALNSEKKRIGDKVAKTVVIINHDKPQQIIRISALIALVLAMYSITSLYSIIVLKNSEPYAVSIRQIEANEDLIKELGGIDGYGLKPEGSINILNGQGNASFEIKIIGKKKNITVHTVLNKEPEGSWEVVDILR